MSMLPSLTTISNETAPQYLAACSGRCTTVQEGLVLPTILPSVTIHLQQRANVISILILEWTALTSITVGIANKPPIKVQWTPICFNNL